MAKAFASSADLAPKSETLEVLGDSVYALTAEGDPDAGAFEGVDFLVCIEADAACHWSVQSAPPYAGTLLNA